MPTFLPIHSAASTSATHHVAYTLYAANLDQAAPFDIWYVERVRTSAAFVGGVVRDYASWAIEGGASDAAWLGRAGLAYAADLLPAGYGGAAALSSSSSSNSGDHMSYMAELPAVSLIAGAWTDVSAAMVSGRSYSLALSDMATGRVAIAAAAPAPAAVVGLDLGHQARDRLGLPDRVRYTGLPVWVWTSYRAAHVQVIEVG